MIRPVVLLERAWRNGVVYPLLRLMIKNRPVALPIDLTTVDSVLVLRYDKIGDMVVTLPIFRILKKHNPSLNIGVLASEANVEIVRGNANVDSLFILSNNPFRLISEMRGIRKAHYRVVLNFIFNRMTSGGLLCNLACRNAIKIGQGQEKYRFYFNALLSIPRGTTHMFDMLVRYVEIVFGLTVSDEAKRMELTINAAARGDVDEFLHRHGLRRRSEAAVGGSQYVVFNVSAGQQNKRLRIHQSLGIAGFLVIQARTRTVVISAPEDRSLAEQVVKEARSKNCILYPETGNAKLQEIGSIVEGGTCVITPDTAVIHMAAAVSTPVVGIFTPLQVNAEWLPYKVRYALIKASEDQPVSSIPLETIEFGIKRFLDECSSQDIKGAQS